MPSASQKGLPSSAAPLSDRDPTGWCALIALGFLALAAIRLGIPTRLYFDEVHYVPAARKLLELVRANPEHPMLGKEIIAASLAALGDEPLFWRIPSLLFGTFGLFAFGRFMWWISLRRFGTLSATVLVATGFLWFIHSRIAMLDMFMASLGMVAFWQFAAAIRNPAQGHWRLALTGLTLGLSLGAKWNIASVAVLPGLAFLIGKIKDNGRAFLHARQGGLVPGISLLEAYCWLGLLPLVVYWLTFAPAFFYPVGAVSPWDFVGQHLYMLELQDSVKRLHPYRSVWYEWMANLRAVWYLYDDVDGAQRGILLIGNPFSMLAGLLALPWCLWAGIRHKRMDALALLLLYVCSLGMWAVSGKPIQFYYHYLLPGTFLMGALGLALDAMWRKGGRWRWPPLLALAASLGMFAWFYPIISAAQLHHGHDSYQHWMWLNRWR